MQLSSSRSFSRSCSTTIRSFGQEFMITKTTSAHEPTLALHQPGAGDGWAAINLGRDTIPLFFLLLNAAISKIRLRGVDMIAYANDVLSEIQHPRQQG